MAQKDKKGGGSRKIGRNKTKGEQYRTRENQTRTAKTRRILAAIKAGKPQPGWKLSLADKDRVTRG